MKNIKEKIGEYNKTLEGRHKVSFSALMDELNIKDERKVKILGYLSEFQVAIPSWALGSGGTRFGKFSIGGEPRNLEEKIEDVGLIHSMSQSCGAISLHIPWDIPKNASELKELANSHDLKFGAVNSNTFQDQKDQKFSYKYGSLSHTDISVRKQAIQHNIDVIEYGKEVNSKALTIWLADGSNFPGQQNFRKALKRTLESLKEIYSHLPSDWKMLIEYKPFEPNFYSMVIPDWGTSLLLANKIGKQAFTLVDLGHHLPNTNIEQIVATLLFQNKLGGFHFNDSKYGDDDLTTGAIKPYQLFLIFCELLQDIEKQDGEFSGIDWMIDASHNTKDPLEDLIQSVESIKIAFAKSLLVDQEKLEEARENNDAVMGQNILQEAFQTDVRPFIRETRLRSGGSLDPIGLYRRLNIRENLIDLRGADNIATGL